MSGAADISAAAQKLALQGIRKRAKMANLRTKLPEETLAKVRAALGLDDDEDDDRDDDATEED